jgi:DNA-binding CsgD family transcriptional regulator
MNMRAAARSIDRQTPGIPTIALGLWIAWNLVAFTGGCWFEETADTWRVFELVNIHLAASVVTLLALFFASEKASAFVKRPASVIAGGAAASLGALLICLTSPTLLHNHFTFIAGCVLAGVGTTFFFVRSAAWLGAKPPRVAFMCICQAAMVGTAGYAMLLLAPAGASRALFCLLPLVTGLVSALHAYHPSEARMLEPHGRPTDAFRNFLIAVFVFSLAAQFLKGGVYPLTRAESHVAFDASTLLIFASAAVFFFVCAATSKQFGFGKIYRPATLAIIALLVLMPTLQPLTGAETGAAVSIAAQYTFNLMVWGMAAYLVFQARGRALRVFCSTNAALSLGSVAGNFAIFATAAFNLSGENFALLSLAIALAAVAVAAFIFPEQKLADMLLPVDEAAFEKTIAGTDRFAPWKAACSAIAQERGLSEREAEVFTLLARGKTNQQVADMLVISPYTVRAHTRNIYAKLDVHSRGELSDLVSSRVNPT